MSGPQTEQEWESEWGQIWGPKVTDLLNDLELYATNIRNAATQYRNGMENVEEDKRKIHNYGKELVEKYEKLKAREEELEKKEKELNGQYAILGEEQGKLQKKRDETKATKEALNKRDGYIKEKEAELEGKEKALLDKEKELVNKEGELKKSYDDFEKQVSVKVDTDFKKELEEKEAELKKKEKNLEAREESLAYTKKLEKNLSKMEKWIEVKKNEIKEEYGNLKDFRTELVEYEKSLGKREDEMREREMLMEKKEAELKKRGEESGKQTGPKTTLTAINDSIALMKESKQARKAMIRHNPHWTVNEMLSDSTYANTILKNYNDRKTREGKEYEEESARLAKEIEDTEEPETVETPKAVPKQSKKTKKSLKVLKKSEEEKKAEDEFNEAYSRVEVLLTETKEGGYDTSNAERILSIARTRGKAQMHKSAKDFVEKAEKAAEEAKKKKSALPLYETLGLDKKEEKAEPEPEKEVPGMEDKGLYSKQIMIEGTVTDYTEELKGLGFLEAKTQKDIEGKHFRTDKGMAGNYIHSYSPEVTNVVEGILKRKAEERQREKEAAERTKMMDRIKEEGRKPVRAKTEENYQALIKKYPQIADLPQRMDGGSRIIYFTAEEKVKYNIPLKGKQGKKPDKVPMVPIQMKTEIFEDWQKTYSDDAKKYEAFDAGEGLVEVDVPANKRKALMKKWESVLEELAAKKPAKKTVKKVPHPKKTAKKAPKKAPKKGSKKKGSGKRK